MARKPRIHVPGGLYHVILRGNGGQSIFPSDADRCRLFLLLQEGTVRFGYRIHAYCLMSNHLHLALQVGRIPLSRAMQNLSFRYTRWINSREGRTGHLFQGRFKALLVDGESYLLELVRYIHLNPVRAGMVRDPADYPWSGHRVYLEREVCPWLTTEWVLGQLGRRKGEALRRYEAFIRDGLAQGHRREFHAGGVDGRILGDDLFLERVWSDAGETGLHKPPLDLLIATVCHSYGLTPAELRSAGQRRSASEGRAMLGWLAQETGGCTLTDIGKMTGRDIGTISSAVRRLTDRAAGDGALREKMERLKRQVQVANLEA